MTRGIRLLGFSALLMIAALVLFMSATDTRATAPPFNPGGQICFENIDTTAIGQECDGNSDPGAASDIASVFCVGWGDVCATAPTILNIDESNFGAVAALVPVAFVPSSAASAPVGAISGQLTANATLGILGGPCATTIKVAFSLMVASTDQGNKIDQKAVGLSNPFEPLAIDVDPRNGIPDGADKYPSYLSEFFKNLQPRARLFGISKIYGNWTVLNFMFFDAGARIDTTAGVDITFKPELGLPSITILGNPALAPSPSVVSDFCAPLRSQNVTFGETYNNPCTPELPETERLKGNCPLQKTAAANNSVQDLNYPYLPCDSGNALDEDGDAKINDGCPQNNAVSETGAECDNAISDEPEDSAVNDGCPPVGDPEYKRVGACSGTDEGKCVIRKNPPAAGTHNFTIVASSQRDADSDGIENGLDVCAIIANGDWNPHAVQSPPGANPQDTDGDGLPNPCELPGKENTNSGVSPGSCVDSNGQGIVGPDDDKDCFSNRADNCPTNSQLRDPLVAPSAANLPDTKDSDSDGIGDACDPNPTNVNGETVGYCIKFSMAVGSPAGPVNGVRDAVEAPACAGQSVTQVPVTQTLPPATPTPKGQTPAPTTGGICTGDACVDSGVGSLSPTNAGVPIWAAVLASLGGLGLLIGAGMLRFSSARRRIE